MEEIQMYWISGIVYPFNLIKYTYYFPKKETKGQKHNNSLKIIELVCSWDLSLPLFFCFLFFLSCYRFYIYLHACTLSGSLYLFNLNLHSFPEQEAGAKDEAMGFAFIITMIHSPAWPVGKITLNHIWRLVLWAKPYFHDQHHKMELALW
jgi:hypothetical protein